MHVIFIFRKKIFKIINRSFYYLHKTVPAVSTQGVEGNYYFCVSNLYTLFYITVF